jgi:glycosyltransferase involved in cell wall biosynthesis
MHILYDHQVFSLQDAGGASRYHFELVRHMKDLPDFSADLIVGLHRSRYPLEDLTRKNVRILSSRSSLKPGFVRYALNEAITDAAAPFRGTADIYHPTLYRICPLIRGRRIVATHHDCIHERFPQLFSNTKRIFNAKRNLFARADAIICISNSARADLLHFYPVDPAKTCVIHHGHNPFPRDAAIGGAVRRQVARPYVLYVGSRPPYKNFNALLHAFGAARAADAFDLVVVGGGALTREERELASSLQLESHLHAFPAASDSLLAEAYANAALFVYPSLYEGFGFPPLEAMSAGCPVLVSACSCLPEICGDGAFYFDPAEPDSLTTMLKNLLADEGARRRMALRGAQVPLRYDWNDCARRTHAVYEACLSGDSVAAAAA